MEVCKRKNLDPFSRQIHPVKRWDSTLRRETMTFQTGIDGFPETRYKSRPAARETLGIRTRPPRACT